MAIGVLQIELSKRLVEGELIPIYSLSVGIPRRTVIITDRSVDGLDTIFEYIRENSSWIADILVDSAEILEESQNG